MATEIPPIKPLFKLSYNLYFTIHLWRKLEPESDIDCDAFLKNKSSFIDSSIKAHLDNQESKLTLCNKDDFQMVRETLGLFGWYEYDIHCRYWCMVLWILLYLLFVEVEPIGWMFQLAECLIHVWWNSQDPAFGVKNYHRDPGPTMW